VIVRGGACQPQKNARLVAIGDGSFPPTLAQRMRTQPVALHGNNNIHIKSFFLNESNHKHSPPEASIECFVGYGELFHVILPFADPDARSDLSFGCPKALYLHFC
jgi:hypothetical protein